MMYLRRRRPTTIASHTEGPVTGVWTARATDCTYTPDAEFNGVDSFTYTITDDGW